MVELYGERMPNTNPSNVPAAALETLRLLADDTRWRIIQALRYTDLQAGELAGTCQLPNNLVSYHIGLLRQAGLIQLHRSDADARVVYYGLNLPALQHAYQQIGAALPLPGAATPIPAAMVVFLCTHNSARSQIAEGWLRHLSGGTIIARSAGVTPTTLHPLAIRVMADVGIDIGYQHSKGLESIDTNPDIVVTVCDRAREHYPSTFEHIPQLHWSIADPARMPDDGTAHLTAFRIIRDQVRDRVHGLLRSLPELLPQRLA